MSRGPQVKCVACSAFRPELEWLRSQGRLDWSIVYVDSVLHMWPERLNAAIRAEVEQARADGSRVVVLFGDCGGSDCGEGDPAVHRVPCENCAQALLGHEAYAELVRQRACCLFTEWARRWREVLGDIPGLGAQLTAEVVRESHHALVFLDTGIGPTPVEDLEACAAHFGLPYEVRAVPLATLETWLAAASRQASAP